jgi:hypothetical protein
MRESRHWLANLLLMKYLLREIRCMGLIFCIPAGRAGADCGERLGVDQAACGQPIQVGGLDHRVTESSDLQTENECRHTLELFPGLSRRKILPLGNKRLSSYQF